MKIRDSSNLKPQSPYAIFKIKIEKYLLKQKKKTNFKFIILRLGTIYGYSPGMRFHTAVNKFCFQAKINLPITVWRTAYNQYRPYLSLLDFSRLINFIISKNIFNNDIYNAVSYNMTVKDIINIIKLRVNKVTIQYTNEKIMNQLSYKVINTRLSKLGFRFRSDIKKEIFDQLDKINLKNNLK